MIFKLFGMNWDIKPIIVFIWMMVVVVLIVGLLNCAFSDDIVGVLVFFFASMIWAYITNTLIDNKIK